MTAIATALEKTQIEDTIRKFVIERSAVKEDYDDYFINIYSNSLLGRRIYKVDWAFEDEEPNYTSFVGLKLDAPDTLEYYDDHDALVQALSLISSEEDKNYKAVKFKQYTDISLDIIAGFIAIAITGEVCA